MKKLFLFFTLIFLSASLFALDKSDFFVISRDGVKLSLPAEYPEVIEKFGYPDDIDPIYPPFYILKYEDMDVQYLDSEYEMPVGFITVYSSECSVGKNLRVGDNIETVYQKYPYDYFYQLKLEGRDCLWGEYIETKYEYYETVYYSLCIIYDENKCITEISMYRGEGDD